MPQAKHKLEVFLGIYNLNRQGSTIKQADSLIQLLRGDGFESEFKNPML